MRQSNATFCPLPTATRRGFSLIELLVVLGVILILLAIVMVPLFDQAVTSSYRASCASNLHQIHTGSVMWMADQRAKPGGLLEKAQSMLDAQNWPGLFQEYTQADPANPEGSVLICPEDNGPTANSIWQFQMHMTLRGRTLAYADFDGPLVMKISNTQYEAAPPKERQRLTHLGDGDGWRTGGAYIPDDDPNHYWLLFEDIVAADGSPTGDLDFEDVQVEVFESGASVKMFLFKGVTNRTNHLVLPLADGTKYDVLGGRELPRGRSNAIELDYFFSTASYGINESFNRLQGTDKIFMIDFDDTVVQMDEPWSDHRIGSSFTFARHRGQVNAVHMDGSVRTLDPFVIDPDITTNRFQFWIED